MKPITTDSLYERLIRKHAAMHFERAGDLLSGYYFSWELRILCFGNQYSILAVQGPAAVLLSDAEGHYLFKAGDVSEALVLFKSTHPFTISHYARGRYQLLDPDGFDYCGEYITLKDARRTSGGFYRMG